MLSCADLPGVRGPERRAHGVDREVFMCSALTVSGDLPNICGFSRNVPMLFKESFKTPAQEGERWEIITRQDGRLL